MKVLVTGANGFIGKNLCLDLKNRGVEVLRYDLGSTPAELKEYVVDADWIIHLAGVNRPVNKDEFMFGNFDLTVRIANLIKESGRKIPVILSSSTQAAFDNDYGKSKKAAEDFLFNFQKKNDNPVYVFRFANAFGKWCRPNYNSVVATFCNNIANDLPIQVNEQAQEVDFVYIDDICKAIYEVIANENKLSTKIYYVQPAYRSSPRKIADLLLGFKESRNNLQIVDQSDEFAKKLYATYLSYLPEDGFSYDLNMHIDERGSFTEILKTMSFGQVSVNVGKPGIVKGNHYHNTKNEKYVVVSGICEIKFRKVGTDKIIKYVADGTHLQVIDIPVGYTHSITNIGKDDSVTLMWASEPFDKDNPDTYFEEVEK